MSKLKENKAFQTIVGGLVLYLLFVAWRDGWFFREDTEGFSSPELLVALTSALLSFVQLVGILTIAIVSGILPQVEELLKWGSGWCTKGLEYLKTLPDKWRNAPKKEGGWNWKPLAAVVLTWFLWTGGHLATVWDAVIKVIPDVIEVLPEKKPVAVIFLLGPEITAEQNLVTSSLRVDKSLEDLKIERRRVLASQDLSAAEKWLRDAVAQAAAKREGSSLICVYADGSLRLKEIPTTVTEMEAIANAWAK